MGLIWFNLRRSHEILIPSVPLAGWDVAFVAEEIHGDCTSHVETIPSRHAKSFVVLLAHFGSEDL